MGGILVAEDVDSLREEGDGGEDGERDGVVSNVEMELGTLTLKESHERVVRVVCVDNGDEDDEVVVVCFELNEQATHSLVLLRRPIITLRMFLSGSSSSLAATAAAAAATSHRGVLDISVTSSSKS